MIGSQDDPRPVVALDWSFHGVHVTWDGEQVCAFASVEDFLADARMSGPHRIAAEATFESWDLERRHRLYDEITAQGHTLYVYRPLHTARARQAAGIDKSDAADARIIWWYAHDEAFHLYPARKLDDDWARRNAELNRNYARVRLSGGKKQLAARAAEVLGPFRERSEDSQVALGSSAGYTESLLAALYFAAKEGLSRREMERLLGLHGSGYPTLLRSDVHTHSFRHASRRLSARDDVHALRTVDRLRMPTPAVATPSGQDPAQVRTKDWTIYRRELRRAFHEIVAALRGEPANSTD
jgi:hypothetical protein